MPYTSDKEKRQKRYQALSNVLGEKGRFPFRKEYQKYAKLLMFLYESLQMMVSAEYYQNREGVLFKIQFTNPYKFTARKEYNGKVILEFGISARASRFKSFEIEHGSIEEVASLLRAFAEYYGLLFVEGEDRYLKTKLSYKYTILLP